MKDRNREQERIKDIEAKIQGGYPDEIYELVSGWNGNDPFWFYTALKERGAESLFGMAQELVILKREVEDEE